MKFRNYCILVLGAIDGVKSEISNIAESELKVIEANGLVMCTFSSVVTPSELKDYFKSFNRNVFLFEIGDDNYCVNLTDESSLKHLFGEYEENGDSLANELTTKLFKTINSESSGDTSTKMVQEVDTMSDSKRETLLNDMLDKGVDNWSSDDKLIVEKLTKKG